MTHIHTSFLRIHEIVLLAWKNDKRNAPSPRLPPPLFFVFPNVAFLPCCSSSFSTGIDICFLSPTQVRRATGTNLAHTTQLMMTLVVGTVIGLAFSWQIGEMLFCHALCLSMPGDTTLASREQCRKPFPPCFFFFFFFFVTLVLSSFWTSRGQKCRPFFPPVLAFNLYRA